MVDRVCGDVCADDIASAVVDGGGCGNASCQTLRLWEADLCGAIFYKVGRKFVPK